MVVAMSYYRNRNMAGSCIYKQLEPEAATTLYEHGTEIDTTEVCGDIWIYIREDGEIEIAGGRMDGF